jgi:hypothetical protein
VGFAMPAITKTSIQTNILSNIFAIRKVSLPILTAFTALPYMQLEHDPKGHRISLFKRRTRVLARKPSKKSAFGIEVELRQKQSFKALQQGIHPFRVSLR